MRFSSDSPLALVALLCTQAAHAEVKLLQQFDHPYVLGYVDSFQHKVRGKTKRALVQPTATKKRATAQQLQPARHAAARSAIAGRAALQVLERSCRGWTTQLRLGRVFSFPFG